MTANLQKVGTAKPKKDIKLRNINRLLHFRTLESQKLLKKKKQFLSILIFKSVTILFTLDLVRVNKKTTK